MTATAAGDQELSILLLSWKHKASPARVLTCRPAPELRSFSEKEYNLNFQRFLTVEEFGWKPPEGPFGAANITVLSFLHSVGGEPLVLDISAGRWQRIGKRINYQSNLQGYDPVSICWSRLIPLPGASR